MAAHGRKKRVNRHKLKQEQLQMEGKEKLFHHEDSQALDQVALRSCVVFIFGGFQHQTG